MSKLNIVSELLLEKNELVHNQDFVSKAINDNLKNSSSKFGIVNNPISDPSFNSFKVESGTNSGTISLKNDSIAVDSDGNAILQEAFDNVAVPTGGIFHVVIEHRYVSVEVGTVSISFDGVLSGVNTLFTSVLRGQPLFPTKVKFYGTSLNTGEYTVVEVINDTSVRLSGVFTPESDLRYSVIGTFTPTALIPSGDREIYRYDSCLFQIIDNTTYLGMLPLIDGKQFKIAEVINTAGVISIKDYRTNIYTTTDKYFIDSAMTTTNPLIGAEEMKWDNSFSTRDKSEMSISWGFRSSNWTVDSSLRKMTFSSGIGGRFKTSGDFTDGDFDGWRLYDVNGNYKKIISSTKSTTSINIVVESLNSDDYTSGDELLVVPDVEEVVFEITHKSSVNQPQLDNQYSFPVNTAVGKIRLLVPSSTTYLYNIRYRYKKFNRYSSWSVLPDDSVGYYDETSYTDGVLNANPVDRTRFPYTSASYPNGYIQVKSDPNSYRVLIDSVNTGDVFGVATSTLSNAVPQVKLFVGTDKKYQAFSGSGLTLSADLFIILENTLADLITPVKNGNSFVMHLTQQINLNGFKLRIVSNFINPTTFVELKSLTNDDILFLGVSEQGLFLTATFDGTNWIMNNVNESRFAFQEKAVSVFGTSATSTSVPTGTTLIMTFPALEFDLLDPSISVSYGHITSAGGAGAAATLGIEVRVNGINIPHLNNTNVIHPYIFQGGYNMFETFYGNFPNKLNKGDVVTVYAYATAVFSPVTTVYNRNAKITGKAIKY